MNKIWMLFVAVGLAIGCNQGRGEFTPVDHAGSMKRTMMEGNISPALSTDTLDFTHLYALGALGNLKGEVLVLDGEPYLSRQLDGKLSISHSKDFDATMMVWAQVPDWQKVHLASLPKEGSFIDMMMAKSAEQKGWDGKLPFAFRLEGKFEKLAYHVINWPEGATNHSPEAHRNSGIRDTLKNVDGVIFGFYSNQHHGVFTHHNSNVHMHFKSADGNIAGHVDYFEPSIDLDMYLPAEFK